MDQKETSNASFLSAAEFQAAKSKREAYAAIVALLQSWIADIDAALAPPKASTSEIQKLAGSLPWKTNSRGEWCYRTLRDGSPDPKLAPLIEAIKASIAEELTLGSFVYSLSGDKFLNRRPA
jgi:hypothetical protein